MTKAGFLKENLLPIFFTVLIVLRLGSALFVYINNNSGIREDTWRDYFIGRRIVYFSEPVTRGPPSNLTNTRFSSPLYYYLCAFFVSVWDDVRVFHIANILILGFSLFLIFLLLSRKFGATRTLMSLFVLTESKFFLDIICSYWGAFINIPVILSGLYFGIYGKTSFKILLGVLVLSVAGVIYNSGYVYLGSFLVYIYFAKRNEFSRSVLIFIVTVSIFYVTVVFDFLSIGSKFTSFNPSGILDLKGVIRYANTLLLIGLPALIAYAAGSKTKLVIKIFGILALSIWLSRGQLANYTFNQYVKVWNFENEILKTAKANSFQMIVYLNGQRSTLIEAGLWANMEKISKQKLVSLDNKSVEGFAPNQPNPKYNFWVCLETTCPSADLPDDTTILKNISNNTLLFSKNY